MHEQEPSENKLHNTPGFFPEVAGASAESVGGFVATAAFFLSIPGLACLDNYRIDP